MSADPRLAGRAKAASDAPVASASSVPQADSPVTEETPGDDTFKLKFCTVCASNQNRYVIRIEQTDRTDQWRHISGYLPQDIQ
jgi:hypothetical protein